ncbi:Death domain-associated protein 6-like [Plakobranchus ocellatus]|uniref:Death domain-associated protein 6-like n=1 Tax=Plakobranchus ocellatus TaxID=259542 RepID=A0AAV4AKH4_9GAST|nr:Death domain-associated protein 6-like [Plakobranchus ocellatus]
MKSKDAEEKKVNAEEEKQRLERLLQNLHDEIQKCQGFELSLDDMKSEDSVYIQKDKLEKRCVEVWNNLCEVTRCTSSTGRPTERSIKFNGTRYREINHKLERFLNRTKSFPDITDVRRVIKETNSKYKLNLSDSMILSIAVEAFKDIGEMLQSCRLEDFMETFDAHETDGFSTGASGRDPYWTDPELRRKLDRNQEIATRNLEKVLFRYSQLQESLKGKVMSEKGGNGSVKCAKVWTRRIETVILTSESEENLHGEAGDDVHTFHKDKGKSENLPVNPYLYGKEISSPKKCQSLTGNSVYLAKPPNSRDADLAPGEDSTISIEESESSDSDEDGKCDNEAEYESKDEDDEDNVANALVESNEDPGDESEPEIVSSPSLVCFSPSSVGQSDRGRKVREGSRKRDEMAQDGQFTEDPEDEQGEENNPSIVSVPINLVRNTANSVAIEEQKLVNQGSKQLASMHNLQDDNVLNEHGKKFQGLKYKRYNRNISVLPHSFASLPKYQNSDDSRLASVRLNDSKERGEKFQRLTHKQLSRNISVLPLSFASLPKEQDSEDSGLKSASLDVDESETSQALSSDSDDNFSLECTKQGTWQNTKAKRWRSNADIFPASRKALKNVDGLSIVLDDSSDGEGKIDDRLSIYHKKTKTSSKTKLSYQLSTDQLKT